VIKYLSFSISFLGIGMKRQIERNIVATTTGVITRITHIATGTALVWKKVEILEEEKDKSITKIELGKQINSQYVVLILDYCVDDESL
jgi:hypothetical protein